MPQCAVITCGNNHRKASNVRYHRFPTESYIREHWKAICGRKDPTYNCQTARVCSLHFSRGNYEKDLEHELLGLPPRTRLRRGAYPDVDVPGSQSNSKNGMKQIPGMRKRLNGKKAAEVGARQNGLEQAAFRKSKMNRKVLSAPRKMGPGNLKTGLNVNERPIRKKKKTKKYETYEREGRSPSPEVRHETNLLLALGLTPVKKSEQDLNRMHIMDEEHGKMPADAAQLPETPADLPKKTPIAVKEEIEEDASPTPKMNGICEKAITEEGSAEDSQASKAEGIKEEVEIIKLPAVTKEEPELKTEHHEKPSSEPQDLTVTCTSAFDMTKTSQSERHYPNSKVISISVEQCQTNHSSMNSIAGKEEDVDRGKKPKQITNRKRSNKSTDSDESYKSNCKRPKFPEFDHLNEERERTVSEYVDKASGSSLEELQRNTEKLQQEIHSLSALARAKELEWNDIIRLKKVKEEMYLRLIRRKQVMLLSMGASGRMSDISNWDFTSENRMSEFFTNDEVSYNPVTPSVSPKPPPRIPSNLTITKSQSNTSQNLQRFLMQPQGSAVDASKPNTSLMMVPIVSSTPLSISSASYLPRPHLATTLKIPMPDRDKLKGNRSTPIPILPKPNQSGNEHSPPIGRQGPIVDVKSIIADYRQNHPEQIPRRGRRLKGQSGQVQNIPENIVTSSRGVLSMSSLALGSGSQVRTVGSAAGNEVSYLVGGIGQNSQDTSRPSSADSNRSTSNATGDVSAGGVSFKDVLVQFAKMSQHQQNDRRNTTPPSKTQNNSKSSLYPEVTLHPVLPSGSQSPPNASSSLLHGILTKSSTGRSSDGQSNTRNTTFSPTLARLLTTPDRSTMSTTITTALRGSGNNAASARSSSGPVSISDLLSTSKNRNELTITPVVSTLQPAKTKEDVSCISEEDPDDSADRLVIDESEDQENRGEDEELDSEGVPECQGCHMKSAQFVCAGCGNQWYCSRNCQVTAWDEHSEVCSG